MSVYVSVILEESFRDNKMCAAVIRQGREGMSFCRIKNSTTVAFNGPAGEYVSRRLAESDHDDVPLDFS
ncbi:MAG: hypothetical protein NPIRA01_00340 [Nitrospirales bacterium]|nr:MAG: hypothetical protein NPIRA01_00340 [Nitrospirales bacterium]